LDLALAGQVAVVTGASRGIGKAIVETLLAEGMSVVANHFSDADGAQRLIQDNSAFRSRVQMIEADVGEAATGEHLTEVAMAQFGRLDVLVHNAGITTRQAIIDTPYEDWQRVLQTNLYGAYFCATAAARFMRGAGNGGSLIGISSLHGRVAKADMGAYCTSKAGIDMLFRQLAVELAPYGIRANTVAPGTIDTGMNPIYHATDAESIAKRGRLFDRVPMRRLGTPEDIARLVAFVASPLSAYTTGTTLYADGGYTADGTPR
jgi:NAD(P)-dependent dehydrogenase (short-subunit alcohol dehydrogenase family)